MADIDGRSTTLAPFKSRVLLVVNVASECGLTGQYAGLQALFEKYRVRGLSVLGFPCNQFGAQEPASNAEIKQFCAANYRVTFPMFAKIDVKGPGRHPLYGVLAGKGAVFPGDVRWNFEKFLVGRDGKVLRRFAADVEPDAEELVAAIEAALAAKP
ncbi:MAG: glutathione peroxidase [Opitutaceae bacterium]|nr:glutathione peroxidase [Opitutaceae bacterium]